MSKDSAHANRVLDPAQVAAAFNHVRDAHQTEVAEDYVELVSDLIAAKGEARSVDLAECLGISAATVNKTVARHEAAATCDDCGERGHTAAACQTRVRNLSLMNVSRCGSCNDTHARGTACEPDRRNMFIRTCVSGSGASLVPRRTFSRP